MKKIFFIALISTQSFLLAQSLPFSFELNTNKLNKINDQTPEGNSVEYIEFMNDTVWIATTVGVSKSGDEGETWSNYKFGDEGISALGINNDTIWIATWHLGQAFGQDVGVGSGLHYSSDGGDNWIDLPQPIDSLKDSTVIYGINSLRASPIHTQVFNFTRSIKFTKNTIWIASVGGYFRKSTDGGKTWLRVVIPSDSLDSIHPDDTLNFTISLSEGGKGYDSNLNYSAFSIEVVNDSTIYLGSAGGINLSTDGGVSWKKFNHTNQDNPISGNHIIDLKYDFSRKILWAATWKANGESEYYGLSSSSDGGETWSTFLSGERVHNISFTYSFDGKEEDILVATDNGIFRSNDLGNSWTIAPVMRDDDSKAKIGTSKFRAVNSTLNNEGNNHIWFGSEGNGIALLKETSGMWEGNWKVFLSSPSLTTEDEVYAFPNPFSPDSEVIKFKYSSKGQQSKVTIRIFDFGMNLVKTVLQNADRKLSSSDSPQDFWNGRDENNVIVPNGVYFYRIDIGDDEPLFGKIIVLM